VYELTRGFPKEETFDLMSQLRWAVCSVPSNIADGLGRDSKKDYFRFPYIAKASLRKMEYFSLLAHDLGYVGEAEYSTAVGMTNEVFALRHGLIG